jgi:shikimate dehydrogenase
MTRCAVLGSPIRHSLSPVLHHAAYEVLGLDWTYEALEVTEDGLAVFLDGLDDTWRGLSLTMPLKRTVVSLVDALSDRAEQAQAANTVVLERGRRTGHNTDVGGISAALRERGVEGVSSAVVLGGGATAASAILGLADLGCREVTLLVRDPSRAAATLETAARHPASPQVDVRGLDAGPVAADVLLSTVPAAAEAGAVLDLVDAVGVVFEVVYDPWPTPLARRAAETGRLLVSGLDLLVHQAVLQVELMTGVEPGPLDAMRRAGENALTGRSLA